MLARMKYFSRFLSQRIAKGLAWSVTAEIAREPGSFGRSSFPRLDGQVRMGNVLKTLISFFHKTCDCNIL